MLLRKTARQQRKKIRGAARRRHFIKAEGKQPEKQEIVRWKEGGKHTMTKDPHAKATMLYEFHYGWNDFLLIKKLSLDSLSVSVLIVSRTEKFVKRIR